MRNKSNYADCEKYRLTDGMSSPQNRLRVNTGQALADNFLLQEESGVKVP